MKAAEREKTILEAAIRFFAENGFEGQTRELAKRAKTAQSALFRHFPTKEVLIEQVYEHVFVSRWNPAWDAIIIDDRQTLEDRLVRFYKEYAERIFDYDWVRIFIYSGLRAHSMMPRYLALIEKKVIVPVCLELRKQNHPSSVSSLTEPVSEREREAIWGLHGQIFYIAVRAFIYGTELPAHPDIIIEDHVRRFFHGIPGGTRN